MSHTPDEVVTHGGSQYAYKVCRCNGCGHQSVCTLLNDFYTLDDPRGPLYCERCVINPAINARAEGK